MLKETITRSESETAQLAARFAATLKNGDILLFHGDLGLGKSVFARALIRALTDDPELTVPSPTFTLLQTYETASLPIWHYDLYRLKDPEEMNELSWDDALSQGIVLIEWPDRLGYLTPRNHINITLTAISGEPESRNIRIEKHEN